MVVHPRVIGWKGVGLYVWLDICCLKIGWYLVCFSYASGHLSMVLQSYTFDIIRGLWISCVIRATNRADLWTYHTNDRTRLLAWIAVSAPSPCIALYFNMSNMSLFCGWCHVGLNHFWLAHDLRRPVSKVNKFVSTMLYIFSSACKEGIMCMQRTFGQFIDGSCRTVYCV